MTLIKRQTLSEATADSLRERILSGELPGGTPLLQEALSQEYGISRVPLREALRQLDAEGLIKIDNHKGARVVSLDLSDIQELLKMRAILERDLIVDAGPHLTEKHLDKCSMYLQKLSEAAQDEDIQSWNHHNALFHMSFYDVPIRPRTVQLIRQLFGQTERYTHMQNFMTSAQHLEQEEHEQILKMCQEGRFVDAGQFIYEHIMAASDALVHYLQEPPKKKK